MKNFFEAFFSAFEMRFGVGLGIGIDFTDSITAEFSRDTYVGIDDGKLITGNIITSELSLFSKIKIGNTYDHLVEKGGERVTSSGMPWDGPFEMMNYPDVTHGNEFSVPLFAINDSGDILIALSLSAHLGAGGHVSVAFNITEFVERLVD